MNFESLIFDIDGTLWDSRALVAEGYNRQLREEGLDHLQTNAEALKPLFGKVLTQIADGLFPALEEMERYALIQRCVDRQTEYLHADPCDIAYPGVKQTIQKLAQHYRLFIVSNSPAGYPELCMEKLGLTPYIQGSLCYGQTGTSKGQTILALMKTHGITSCAYIGDTQKDYEATVEANIPFIWASYGFGTTEYWDFRIDGFEELLNLL